MDKAIFFYILCFLCLIDYTNFVFLVPILPDFLLSHGISLTMIGFILSAFQISNFFTSLYLSKYLVNFSKPKVIIIGQIFLITSNLAMAVLNYCSSITLMIFLSIFLRLIQGISEALVISSVYSYVILLYPEDLDSKYTVMEIFMGGGLALGPLIAGVLYEYTKFTLSFLIITILYILTGIIFFPYMIKYQAYMDKEPRNEKNLQINEEKKQIDTIKIITNRNFTLTLWVFVFALMTYSVIQPGFSDHIHGYNGTDDVVGLIFGIVDIAYALTGFFMMTFIKSSKIKRKYFFLFGGSLSAISLLIIGPEQFTYLPISLITVAIGMGINGMSQMLFVPICIPEFLDILNEIDPNAKGNEEMACGLFNAAVSITLFLGSIVGGFLAEKCGFKRGMAIYGIFLIGFLILYGFGRKFKNKKKINGISNAELCLLENGEK